MRRNLLHVSKLDAFKKWLADGGIPHREGRGEYQLLQIQRSGHWHAIYSRLDMPEHVTVSNPLVSLVGAFIRNARGTLVSAQQQLPQDMADVMRQSGDSLIERGGGE